MEFIRKFYYKNLAFLFLSIILALFLSRVGSFNDFLLNLGTFGYLGAFIGGILFVSTFTAATGVLILFTLAKTISPFEIGLIAGLGAVVGDFGIFRFVRGGLTNELETTYNRIDTKHHFVKLLHTKYFSWSLPVIGAIIIASPFPDELGVSLIGISKIKTYQFLIISFFLNAIGIFLVVSASYLI